MTTGPGKQAPQQSGGKFGITPNGKKRMKVGCFFAVFFMGVGFYGGLSAAKKAIDGPDWMRRATGINLQSAPTPVQNQPFQQQQRFSQPQNMQAPVNQQPNQQGNGQEQGSTQRGTDPSQDNRVDGGNTLNPSTATAQKPVGNAVIGVWEITDEIHLPGAQPTTATTQYSFDKGGKGSLAINGKKYQDFTWEDNGETLKVSFNGESERDDSSPVQFLYTINQDGTLLTLSPRGKLDPRGELYHLGSGVYHRK